MARRKGRTSGGKGTSMKGPVDTTMNTPFGRAMHKGRKRGRGKGRR